MSRAILSFIPRLYSNSPTPPKTPWQPLEHPLPALTSPEANPRPIPPANVPFAIVASLSWAAVMYMFRHRGERLQPGIVNSMREFVGRNGRGAYRGGVGLPCLCRGCRGSGVRKLAFVSIFARTGPAMPAGDDAELRAAIERVGCMAPQARLRSFFLHNQTCPRTTLLHPPFLLAPIHHAAVLPHLAAHTLTHRLHLPRVGYLDLAQDAALAQQVGARRDSGGRALWIVHGQAGLRAGSRWSPACRARPRLVRPPTVRLLVVSPSPRLASPRTIMPGLPRPRPPTTTDGGATLRTPHYSASTYHTESLD